MTGTFELVKAELTDSCRRLESRLLGEGNGAEVMDTRVFYSHGGILIHHGDCRDVTFQPAAKSIDHVLTVPLYDFYGWTHVELFMHAWKFLGLCPLRS